MPQRSRKMPVDLQNPIVILLCALLAFMLVLCLFSCGSNASDPTETTVDTTPVYGFNNDDTGLYYLLGDGNRATGWQELNGQRYYFKDDGYAQVGWMDEGEKRYFFRADGTMATGKVTADGTDHYFTSQGQEVLLVNRWNPLPDGYTPNLVDLDTTVAVENCQVDAACYEALLTMIADCNDDSPRLCVVSGYRSQEYQTNSYNRKVKSYLDQGYSQEQAEEEAGTIIARPGTSEHQLGLAVDIIDTRLWELDEKQADLPAQKWLMENSWRYGFVLRYPNGKLSETGIIYEPWHYRYVGLELAKELHDTGMTLEAYLEYLTR